MPTRTCRHISKNASGPFSYIYPSDHVIHWVVRAVENAAMRFSDSLGYHRITCQRGNTRQWCRSHALQCNSSFLTQCSSLTMHWSYMKIWRIYNVTTFNKFVTCYPVIFNDLAPIHTWNNGFLGLDCAIIKKQFSRRMAQNVCSIVKKCLSWYFQPN